MVFDLLSLSPKQTFAGPHPRGQSADLGYSRALRPGPVIQKSAFRDDAAKLDGVRRDAARDLLSAMENNPALERAIGQLQGRERTIQLVAGLRDEHRIRQDPNLRAERLVTFWNRLEHEHARTDEWGPRQEGVRLGLEARMENAARDLKRDPRAEAILRSRANELGLEPGSRLSRVLGERNIEKAMTESIRLSRGRRLSRGPTTKGPQHERFIGT